MNYTCERLITPRETFAPGALAVESGRIVRAGAPQRGAPAREIPGTVIPGLVDLQVNGWGKRDVRDADAKTISEIGRDLLAHGVTSWLPTIVSCPEEVRMRTLDAINDARKKDTRVLGAHLEGPWLSPVRAGAHDPQALERPSADVVSQSLSRHPDLVRIVTLAPEVPGGMDALGQVVGHGAVASIGHSDASAAEIHSAADAGARMATHLYNAMRPFHHREPGVVGAVLVEPRLVAGLIADGVHVDPSAIALAFRAKGAGRIALVSDIVAGEGPPTEGAARLRDGTLAGAVRGLGDSLAVVVGSGISLEDAVQSACLTPSDLLGLSCGRLEPRAPADFVVLDEGLRVRETYLGGERVWSA